jgi:hypothetical protein
MLARAKGELLAGDAYIRAVVELQADLESRRFGDAWAYHPTSTPRHPRPLARCCDH